MGSHRPYETKSTVDLLNSLLVFQLCSMPTLVKVSPMLIEMADKLKLGEPMYWLIKQTLFKHFCGGEDLEEVVPTMEAFKKSNIGSILDLALEADLSAASLTGTAAQLQTRKVAEMFRESINIASQTSGSFVAIKVTALVPPVILQRWSNTVLLLQKTVKEMDTDRDGKLNLTEFKRLGTVFPALTDQVASRHFERADRDRDGLVDWIDMTDVFSLYQADAALALIRLPIEPVTKENQLITKEDIDTIQLLIPEINSVGQHAQTKRVRVMVDAEQTYFQPAIDDVALNLLRRFNLPIRGTNATNRNEPILYNTYQMYLRDAYDRMVMDVERAERGGYAFGVKIVRGAYMHAERERAHTLGIPDPIQPTVTATHTAYNHAIQFLIQKISTHQKATPHASTSASTRPLSFVVASHNKASALYACQQMATHGVPPSDRTVAFAQLMGMQDGTTFVLAKDGYSVFKYIPYGPIDVTIPYLQRRALENADVLAGGGGVAEDRGNIVRELRMRFAVATGCGG
ncbi:FAD-linked oxidoreductase-like protein [Gaertneriomyces semiglobifer]|nr:FAD-linked oxidoreductase-like protein [Gaertneriomyces semiglobifer]